MATFTLKRPKGKNRGFVRALKGGLKRVAVNAPKEIKRQLLGALLGRILPEFYPADKVLNPNGLLQIIVAIYLAVPPEWRFVAHEVIEGSIDAWLPEDSPFKNALHDTFAATHFATEAFLSRNDLTDEKIRAKLGPTLQERFTHYGGTVSDHNHEAPAAAPALPNYIDKRAKLADPVGAIIDRLLALAELGSRKGKDPNPEVEGVAAMLRTAITEEVSAAETDSVNKLITPWGDAFITQLLAADNPTFLGNERVQRLIGTFMGCYHKRHPGMVTPETADAMDTFLEGYGVPSQLRGPLKKLLNLDNIESAADKIENTVYPGLLWSMRGWFSLPVSGAAFILGMVTVLTLGVQTFILNEYTVALETLSGFELARRAIGFVLNAAYQLAVPGFYLLVAILVALPFMGIRRRRKDGAWWMLTWGRPTKPTLLPWHLKPRADEKAEAFEARLQRAKLGITAETRTAEEARYAQEYEEYEEMDDDWRAAFRRSLFVRAAIVVVTLIVGTILVVVAGLVVSIPTYQHMTVIQMVVVAVINFHILWLGDDLANAIRASTTKEPEHAHAAAEGEHAAAGAHAEEAHEKRITRIRKIAGTMTIIVAAAAFTYAVAIELAPWHWAVGTLLPVYLMLGLAVFIVSRILFGDSSDAPHDVQEDSGKQRRFVHKVVAGTFGFGGAVVFVTSMALSVAIHGYGWWQACQGFEGTDECSLFHNGYGQYVDSPDRWEALRDRSAKALPKRAKPKPVGNSCVIATKEVSAIEADYRTSVLSGTTVVADSAGVCESLADDVELRKRFPDWSKTCAVQRVACKKG